MSCLCDSSAITVVNGQQFCYCPDSPKPLRRRPIDLSDGVLDPATGRITTVAEAISEANARPEAPATACPVCDAVVDDLALHVLEVHAEQFTVALRAFGAMARRLGDAFERLAHGLEIARGEIGDAPEPEEEQ